MNMDFPEYLSDSSASHSESGRHVASENSSAGLTGPCKACHSGEDLPEEISPAELDAAIRDDVCSKALLPEEISPAELDALPAGRYLLIDTREEEEYDHGFIPGCVRLAPEDVRRLAGLSGDRGGAAPGSPFADSSSDDAAEHSAAPAEGADSPLPLPVDSPFAGAERIVLYCRYGQVTRDLAEELRELGFPAQNLAGGYGAWALHAIERQARSEEVRARIELGLQKGHFHRDLLNPFARGIIKYEMIQDGDRIAVCISGGKDSMLMAKLFQELQRHSQFTFELVFLCMDPGYSPANRQIIERNADLLGIPIEFFESDIFDSVERVTSSPCYLCARMRRGYLYKEAKARDCNKIALGHHFDDVIETVFMGMLYSGQWAAMMPKLRSTNFEGMELIRPMYFVREEDIKRWRDENHLHFIQCACHFTDTCTTCAVVDSSGQSAQGREHSGHKRTETKRLIAELKKTNPDIETNLFHATENVMVDKLLGYKKDGVSHTFLEDF